MSAGTLGVAVGLVQSIGSPNLLAPSPGLRGEFCSEGDGFRFGVVAAARTGGAPRELVSALPLGALDATRVRAHLAGFFEERLARREGEGAESSVWFRGALGAVRTKDATEVVEDYADEWHAAVSAGVGAELSLPGLVPIEGWIPAARADFETSVWSETTASDPWLASDLAIVLSGVLRW